MLKFLFIIPVAVAMATAQLSLMSDFGCPLELDVGLPRFGFGVKPGLSLGLDYSFIFDKELPARLYPTWTSGRPAFPFTIRTASNMQKFGILQQDSLIPTSLEAEFRTHVARLEEDFWNDELRWEYYESHRLLNLVDNGLYTVVSGVTRAWTRVRVDGGGSSNATGAAAGRLSIIRLDDPKSRLTAGGQDDYSTRCQMLPTDVVMDVVTRKVKARSYINNLHPGRYAALYEDIESILGHMVPLWEQALQAVTPAPELAVNLRGRKLQVVVTIKSVFLIQGRYDKFLGSQWHTEGLRNEDIVATALYYYDVANITESRLDFKLELNSHFLAANASWGEGLLPEEANYVPLGSLTCSTGRIVVFPNIYHHKVAPYQLAPGAAAGHRKILVFFLLDPNRRVPSTSDVPPQQRDWYEGSAGGVGGGLSGEFPFDMSKALEYREGFNKERAASQSCKTHGRRD